METTQAINSSEKTEKKIEIQNRLYRSNVTYNERDKCQIFGKTVVFNQTINQVGAPHVINHSNRGTQRYRKTLQTKQKDRGNWHCTTTPQNHTRTWRTLMVGTYTTMT